MYNVCNLFVLGFDLLYNKVPCQMQWQAWPQRDHCVRLPSHPSGITSEKSPDVSPHRRQGTLGWGLSGSQPWAGPSAEGAWGMKDMVHVLDAGPRGRRLCREWPRAGCPRRVICLCLVQ